jgi:4-diphosphocytidyl-2C-methyl-D-erythritol kinase
VTLTYAGYGQLQSKINETKDIMKRKAQEIEKAKLESKSKAAMSGLMTGFGSDRWVHHIVVWGCGHTVS